MIVAVSACLTGGSSGQQTGNVPLVIQSKERVDALFAQGDFATAIGLLEDEVWRQTSDWGQAWALVRLAEARRAAGARAAARADLDDAETLIRNGRAGPGDDAKLFRARVKPYSALLCQLYCIRAQIFLEWGLLDLAWRTTQSAQRIRGWIGDDPEPTSISAIFAVHFEVANVLSAREDYELLQSEVDEFLCDAVYEKQPARKALLLARLGMALKESARLDPSAAARSRAALHEALSEPRLASVERVQPELALAALALRDEDWSGAQRWLDSATRRLGTPDRRNETPQSEAWAATGARLALDRTDRPVGRAELETWRDELRCLLAWRLDDLRNREPRRGGYGLFNYANQLALMSELVRLELVLAPGDAGLERALEHVLAAGDVGTLSLRLDPIRSDLTRARRELLVGDDALLLIYFPAAERTHLFVVDARELRHFELACSDEIEQARSAAVSSLNAPLGASARDWQRSSRARKLAQLGELVIPSELRARLETGAPLTIIGRDLLGELPFDVLPRSDGRALGLTNAITYLPSVAVGLRLARRARLAPPASADEVPGTVVLVAAPSSSGLELGETDEQQMLGAFPEAVRTVLHGRAATWDRLAASVGDARVLQIFSHGVCVEENERPAAIVLDSESGPQPALIGCDEVERLSAPPLVLLTVCRSAAAHKRRGDAGAADLAGAFFAAGKRCRCVVLSAFDLDSEAARRLALRFHAELVQGIEPAEALRRARVELAQDPLFADPFYYGLIGVVGTGHVPVFRR